MIAQVPRLPGSDGAARKLSTRGLINRSSSRESGIIFLKSLLNTDLLLKPILDLAKTIDPVSKLTWKLNSGLQEPLLLTRIFNFHWIKAKPILIWMGSLRTLRMTTFHRPSAALP